MFTKLAHTDFLKTFQNYNKLKYLYTIIILFLYKVCQKCHDVKLEFNSCLFCKKTIYSKKLKNKFLTNIIRVASRYLLYVLKFYLRT